MEENAREREREVEYEVIKEIGRVKCGKALEVDSINGKVLKEKLKGCMRDFMQYVL